MRPRTPAAPGACARRSRRAGIEVWFDQSVLRGGDAWDATIRRQIKSCALFIPIISRNTHAREEGYFRLEWKLAVDRSHLMTTNRTFLLPVVIDETGEDDEQVPDRFRELQWTRLAGDVVPTDFVDRVRRLLGTEPRALPESMQRPRSRADQRGTDTRAAARARPRDGPRLRRVAKVQARLGNDSPPRASW